MANKAKPGRFTEAELELMDILWDSGACTVQGVIDRLPPSRPLAYTTAEQVVLAMVKSRQLSPQKLSELRKLVEDADGRSRK